MVNEEIRAIAERIRKNIAIMIFTSLNPLELCQNAYCSLIGLERQRGADIIVGHESAFAERKNRPTIEREVYKEGILLYG